MKRIFWILPVLLLLTLTLPAAAQDATVIPLDWIPADFSGFIRVDMSDPQTTLNSLNLTLYIASVLQPPRVQVTQRLTYDAFFPLTNFDMENSSFTRDVLPWLNGEIIIAYQTLGAKFDADASNTVLILPTKDAFQSADFLNQVVKAQDFLRRETYRDVIVYNGDKTSFAFTPSAVIVGPDALLHETLDTMSGSGQALTADPVYQQVRSSLPANNLLLGYVGGDTAARALGVLMSGSGSADSMLMAIGQALAGLSSANTPERLLLSGALDGIGITVNDDEMHSSNVQANVVVHTNEAPDAADATFDPTVLDLIPRSALLVQSGTDASSVATDALYALPFLNFAARALAAFPVAQSTAPIIQPPVPSAQDVQTAVSTFLMVIKPTVDVQGDLLDKLKGSYSLALLPRLNDPIPGLDAPIDLLLVVKTDSPAAAQTAADSVSKLMTTFLAPPQSAQIDAQTFQALVSPSTGEALISVGAVGDLFVIGTGTAPQLALDAQGGDNRLTTQDRWQNLSQHDEIPYVYVDVNAYYDTFLPTLGGPSIAPINQLGIHSRYLGSSLFALDVLVALAQ